MYPQIFGKYLLEREIAQGGMARVHLATLRGAEGFEKKLVVKQIREEYAQDPEFVDRFVREAKTNVAMNHPNIVTVYELGIEAGTYFLAMEYVDGVSVSELLGKGPSARHPLSPEEGAYLGIELAKALDYAHRRMQVIHRDVTPRNVMIDEEGRVKLIDFGIAARAKGTLRETFGSPGHMAPEQIEGGELLPETDLFAAAALLLEAWSGVAPFRRTSEEECKRAVFAVHPKPSDFNPALSPLDDIVARSLAKSAQDRPTVEEFGKQLRRFMGEVDEATVQRALGERVRAARSTADDPTPPELGRVPPPEPPRTSETRTFATRDEFRPMPIADASKVLEGTRRLEDPPRSIGNGKDTRVRPLRISLLRLPIFAAVLLSGAYLFWRTPKPTPVRAPPNDRASAPSASGSQISSATSAQTVLPRAREPLDGGRDDASPVATMPSVTRVSASPSGTSLRGVGFVSVFGDPGTVVRIDGQMRGGVPLRRLEILAGAHEVRVDFEPTGESRGEAIRLGPDDRIVVFSRFTGAQPVLRIEREP